MPYSVRKGTGKNKGKKCVYKKNTNKLVGCTDGPIKDYLAALHMHADESVQRRNIMKLTKLQLKQIIKEELQEVYGGSFDYGRNPAEELEPEDWPEKEEPEEESDENKALKLIQEAMTLLAPIRPEMIERLADVTAELRNLLGIPGISGAGGE